MTEETPIKTGKQGGVLKTVCLLICCVAVGLIAVASVINAIFFQPVEIVGSSMENTLHNGEVILINRRQTPTYGDIIFKI